MLSAPTIPNALRAAPAPGFRAPPKHRLERALADGGQIGPGDIPLRFTSALERAGKSREERAAEAAEEFVALALVQPTLRALRESNRAAPPFAPGDAERKFGAMLDAEQARRIVGSSNFPLVGAVRDRMLGTYAQPAPLPPRGGREIAPFKVKDASHE